MVEEQTVIIWYNNIFIWLQNKFNIIKVSDLWPILAFKKILTLLYHLKMRRLNRTNYAIMFFYFFYFFEGGGGYGIFFLLHGSAVFMTLKEILNDAFQWSIFIFKNICHLVLKKISNFGRERHFNILLDQNLTSESNCYPFLWPMTCGD